MTNRRLAERARVRELRRLRRRITILFTLASAAGLALIALVIVFAGRSAAVDRLDGELRFRAEAAARVLTLERESASDVSALQDAEVFSGDVGITLVEGEPLHLLPLSDGPAVGEGVITDLARDAMTTRAERFADATAMDGTPVRLVANPYPEEDEPPQFAVVAAASLGPIDAEIAGGAVFVMLVWAVLVLALAGIGRYLAGRSLRPAAAAFDQQERFLADAAHELSTPLASLRAVGESAAAGVEDPATAISSICEITAHTSSLVDDLLALARMDAGAEAVTRQPVRLDLLVEEVVAHYPGVELDAAESVVNADSALVRRAVRNLVDNAFAHGAVAGKAADVAVGVRGNCIQVADGGPGVDPDSASRLFDRFYSGGPGRGAGIGLSIVAWVAQEHGGSVSVANRDGGGATFTLTLG